MAINFATPTTTDNYSTAFVPNIQANQTALAQWLDSSQATITGTPPTYAKRYNRTNTYLEEFNGAAWVTLPHRATNSDALNGQPASFYQVALGFTPVNANVFMSGGLAEIGRYLDFHGGAGAATDYDARIDCGPGTGATGGGAMAITATSIFMSGALTAAGAAAFSAQVSVAGVVWANSSSNLKVGLTDSGQVRGYISADATYCFRTINGANSAYVFSVDNSGNGSFNGGISATTGTFSSAITASQATFSGGVASGSQCISNFNMHLDSGAGNAVYLNYFRGSGGVQFCNGANGVTANMSNTGTLNCNGNVIAGGTVQGSTVTQTSDERKKEGWQDLPADFVDQLAGIERAGTFNWISNGNASVGVGAQSLERIMPAAVHTDEDGAKTVNYGGAALAACVVLARELVALRNELAAARGAV